MKSNRKLSRAKGGISIDHRKYVDNYRANVMRVLRDIRAGIVNEEDVDKLQNFCQASLALWNIVDMRTIQSAWTNAEIMGLFKEDLQSQIVPDPRRYCDSEPATP